MRTDRNLATRLPDKAKVLVVDLGFIGDVAHLLPALHSLKTTRPDLRLDVAVSEHAAPLLRLFSICDRVLPYQRYPKARPWPLDAAWMLKIRREKYDAAINLTGSVRTSIITWLTGAPHRVGSEPQHKRWFWPLLYTDTVAIPHGQMSVYKHRLAAVEAMGFRGDIGWPCAEIPIGAQERAGAAIGEQGRRFFVFVPYSSEPNRDLPDEVMVSLLVQINRHDAGLGLILCSGPNAGERARLRGLLAKLPFQPYRVVDGFLDLPAFMALVGRAEFYLGTDGGALHLACLMRRPCFSWFRDAERRANWLPDTPECAGLVGRAGANTLEGIGAEQIIGAVKSFRERLGK